MSSEYSIVTKKHNFKRVLAFSIAILIALPLLFFLVITGQSLLTRAEDLAPHDVVVSNITKATATVSWISDKSAQAVVEYGISPTALHSFAPEQSPRSEHSVDLTLLTSSTTYYFQIRVGDKAYDNGGMPWTFTTKSESGEDVTQEVRGISTRISRINQNAQISKAPVCDVKTCSEIQSKLGKGCTISDYIKAQCVSGNLTGSPPKGSTTVSPTITGSALSPTPAPTSVVIQSELCQITFLEAKSSSCTTWTWANFDTLKPACQKAFSRYILECKTNNFNTSGGELNSWSISDIGSPNYTFDADDYGLDPGDTVHCRVRAEDKVGNSTEWQNNKEPKTCS